MADSGKANEVGTEAAQPANGEQVGRPQCDLNMFNFNSPVPCSRVLVSYPHTVSPTCAQADQCHSDSGYCIQGLVSRVSSLPLVSSACGAVSSAYTTTKDSVPLLKGVMDVAETGVRTLGAAASTGSKPLLDMLEPQSMSSHVHTK